MQVHRAFHIAALFVAVIGFILAFVANKDGNPQGLIELGSTNVSHFPHSVLGLHECCPIESWDGPLCSGHHHHGPTDCQRKCPLALGVRLISYTLSPSSHTADHFNIQMQTKRRAVSR